MSAFFEGTEESPWAPGGGNRTYIVFGETCCDFSWQKSKGWPMLSLPAFQDDGIPPSPHHIIGALWVAGERTRLVGIWGCSLDESHVEFFGRCKPQAEEDLNAASKALCEDICPELIDVFDDGSGSERTAIPVESNVMDEAESLLVAALGK